MSDGWARQHLRVTAVLVMGALVTSCVEREVPTMTLVGTTAHEWAEAEGDCDPDRDPNCKLVPLSEDGRRYVYRVLSHINRMGGMNGECNSYYTALEDALMRNAIAQWDDVVLRYDIATNTYKLVLGDTHPKFNADGSDAGYIHFWSGLWDGRYLQTSNHRPPEQHGLHEGVHRHYHRMGDLLSDPHPYMDDVMTSCFSGIPM